MRADQAAASVLFAGSAGYCLWIHEPWWAAVIAALAVAWLYVTR